MTDTDLHALRQRQLDAVWDWFVVQGKPRSIGVDDLRRPQCCYRSETGLRCGVGVLIPDELYESSIEGMSASSVAADSCGSLPELSKALGGLENSNFLDSIQFAHDSSFPYMEVELREIALRYNLTVPS